MASSRRVQRLLRAARRRERAPRVVVTIGGMRFGVEGVTFIETAEAYRKAFGRPAPILFGGGEVSFTCTVPLTEERADGKQMKPPGWVGPDVLGAVFGTGER